MQYDRFPYHEELEGERIGKMIYETMASSYNNAVYEDNTLIVYTMDGFLNEAQAGTCIINYYKNITKQMREEQCFCGERVGVLVQSNSIPEDTKDAKTERNLLYNVGEVIHIGMNQATYVALKEKIKPKDFLMTPNPNTSGEEWMEDIQRFVKEHISNKGILIYPNNPVYVNRIKSGLQKDVLKKREANSDDFSHDKFFCLYHVMLRTLRYTNEIVVDISKNSLQALFWLGAAHGSDIYAITVQHEETNREREMLNVPLGKKERSIFDVAGLWTAILRSNDTEGFYRQLTMAQIGIERHTKLILKELDYFEERLRENLYEIDGTSSCNEIIEEKQNEEKVVLESYYRDCFWRQMLRYNRLWLYLPQVDNEDSHDREPRIHIVRWDMDAVALLSHYLSKRKIIGEYRFKPLAKGQFDEKADKANFICIGDAARPLERAATEQEQNSETREQTESLAEYIWRQITSFGKVKRTGSPGQKGQIIYKHWENGGSGNALCQKQGDDCEGKQCVYKGFVRFGTFPGENFPGIITQLPNSKCIDCDSPKFGSENEATSVFYYNTAEIPTNCCNLKHTDFLRHTQVAQLILWREIPKTATGRVYFRVALTGASGPATYGLASIFVDDDQKEELFKADGEKDTKQSPQWDKNLLSKLQEKARSKFIEDYCDRLQDRLREIPPDFRGKTGADVSESQKNCYFERVKYATVVYLNTVLYRHFLPFLSIEDENCICNGMRTYIASMMAACVSPFSLDYPPCGDKNFNTSASPKYVNAAADAVTEVLKSTLWGFRGIEAFYRVEVEVRGAEKSCETKEKEADTKKEEYYRRDTRIPKGIWEIEDKEDKVFDDVNCIFFEDV